VQSTISKQYPTHTYERDAIARYRAAFIPDHRAPYGIQWSGRDWQTRNDGHLTDGCVQRHLDGKAYYASSTRPHTPNITVDLDVGPGLDRRCEKVVGAFPDATPLIFSTPRGGLHLDYLTEKIWTKPAVGFVKDQLRDVGLDLVPGQVEVLQDRERGLRRLPLGKDCYLLDGHSLDPISHDRFECLEALDEILHNDKVDRLYIPEGYTHPAPNTHKTKPSFHRKASPNTSTSDFMIEVSDLLTHGLQEPGTRVDYLLKLSWYYHVVEGREEGEVVGCLEGWLRENHNGNSRTYNQSPEKALKSIRGIVDRFDFSKVTINRSTNPQTAQTAKPRLWIDYLRLGLPEREMLRLIYNLADQRGEVVDEGRFIDVDVPSLSMKGCINNYRPVIELLESKRLIQRVGKARMGQCRRYRILIVDGVGVDNSAT
jgi:hypothetical protein